jgi:hypothetical protein
MSAKKAKLIRKLTKSIIAQQIAKGEQVSIETLYIEKEANRKYGLVDKKIGVEKERVVIAAGTIMTTPGSTRGIYRAIKKKLASKL